MEYKKAPLFPLSRFLSINKTTSSTINSKSFQTLYLIKDNFPLTTMEFISTNSRSAIAATATGSGEFRVYFQDVKNGVYEADYNETWTFNQNVLFLAKRSSHLAAVSWNNGNQVSNLLPYGIHVVK
jgi:hypothetical protein